MRGPRTLRGRLSLSALGVSAVALLLLTVAFNVLLARRLEAEVRTVLAGRAAAVIDTITLTADGGLVVADNDDDAIDAGVWVYSGRTAVQRAPGSARLQAAADRLAGTAHARVRVPGVEYLSEPVLRSGRRVGTVVTAVAIGPYRRTEQLTLAASGVLAVLLLALVYAVTRLGIGRALEPVGQMTRLARERMADDPRLRFGDGDRPRELAELATTLDALMDQLSAVLRREQQFTGELSHELRTPLASISAEVELFASRPRSPAEAGSAMAAIGASAERMERILEALLTAARAGVVNALGRCDAAAAVAEAVRSATALHPGVVSLDVRRPGLAVGVEQGLLERVLGPLLDNALRYARTAVTVRVDLTAGQVGIDVRDDGPGVPAAHAEQVFEPGWRQVPDDGHDGAGLGLALARRLARAAGGELCCRPGPSGHFQVLLPAA